MQVDIFAYALQANPYPTFAMLRAQAPLAQIGYLDGQPAWLVSRYDDVLSVLKDRRFVTDPRLLADQPPPPSRSQLWKLFDNTMLSFDSHDHTRLRTLVQLAFTPQLVAAMRPRVQAIADALLDRLADQHQADLMAAYAAPLSMTVITELLGTSGEQEQFQAWFDRFSEMEPPTGPSPQQASATQQFIARLQQLFAERRLQPRADLLTALVQAEQAGDRLSEDELLAMVFLLIFAGQETTRNLIGSSVLALLLHPDQLALLRAEPARIPTALEELLRYTSPAQGTTLRIATTEIELAGVRIPRGGRVLAVLGAANRDEQHFSDPEQLDLTRTNNRHIAFGSGIHHCLGAPLARLEGVIALETLLRRLPNIQLAVPPEQLQWRPNFLVHGLIELPLTFSGS